MSPTTYPGASCTTTARRPPRSSRGARNRASASTNRQCCATEKMCAPLVWPFQRATRAKPCAMSSSSMSSGDGSSRSSRRPDSMRCQARGSDAGRAARLSPRAVSATAARPEFLALRMAIAGDQMIVDHADRLHEGIDDGRPAEFEAALRQLLGDRARDCGLRRHLASRFVVIDLGLAVDEVPQQLREARPLVHDIEPGPRRAHGALDLGAIAHDAGILHQPLELGRPVARDFLRNEIVEGAAEVLPLAQDGDPRQPGLETVEHEFFIERAIVVFRHAPFLVVIGDVERIVLGPRTAHDAVCMYGRFHWAEAFIRRLWFRREKQSAPSPA